MKKPIMIGLGFIRHSSEEKSLRSGADNLTAIPWWRPQLKGLQIQRHVLQWTVAPVAAM
ncbi:MAG: hypothetical protein KAJ55_02595 [Anaerolineales bacterium]|nr:hypothetical protein [Anaerolineales bacterium]